MLPQVRPLALAAGLLLAAAGGPLPCPPGTTRAGEPPPGGFEVWCERPDPAGQGRRHGPSRAWYDDGGIHSEATWRDGVLHGPFVEYYRGGRRARQGEYRDGEKQGAWTVWFENGASAEEAEFDRGRLHGRFASFWENGNRRAEGRYCQGLQCGRWTAWSEDGTLLGVGFHEEIRGTP